MKWIELTILDHNYFKLNTDGSPIHLVILDEIVRQHCLLHERVMQLLVRLFSTNFVDLDNLVQVSYNIYHITHTTTQQQQQVKSNLKVFVVFV